MKISTISTSLGRKTQKSTINQQTRTEIKMPSIFKSQESKPKILTSVKNWLYDLAHAFEEKGIHSDKKWCRLKEGQTSLSFF